MANNYKFTGHALATTAQTSLLTAGTGETIIIKSLRVTNNTGNTPTVTLDVTDSSASATYQILRTKSLTANNSEEILTEPLVAVINAKLSVGTTSTDNPEPVSEALTLDSLTSPRINSKNFI